MIKDTFFEDFSVRYAVECYTTGQAQVAFAGHCAGIARHLQHHFFRHHLNRGGQVHLTLTDRGFWFSGPAAEQARESVVCHRQSIEVAEVIHIHPDRAIFADFHQMFFDVVNISWLAIRREAHQLVLAGVDLESAEIGERAVKQA